MGSGSYELTAQSVKLDGDTLAVTLTAHNPTAPYITTDLCQWCVLVECNRVDGVPQVTWDLLPEQE